MKLLSFANVKNTIKHPVDYDFWQEANDKHNKACLVSRAF